MEKLNIKKWACFITGLVFLLIPIKTAQFVQAQQKQQSNIQFLSETDETEIGTLYFNNQFQLKLGKKDRYGRATAAHILLNNKDTFRKKKEMDISYNPIGWHNYKFYYNSSKDRAWLMERGQLIPYQFSGLSNEGKNLVPMTAWLNSGNFKTTNSNNQDSILYYVQRLEKWLADNSDYWLDYKVTPIYTDDELIPRKIELQYVGFDADGNVVSIQLDSGKEELDIDGMTHVWLDNVSPNAEINYKTGTAKNTSK